MIKLCVGILAVSVASIAPLSSVASPVAPEVSLGQMVAFGERCKELDPIAAASYEAGVSYILKTIGLDRVRQLQKSPLYSTALQETSKALRELPISEVEEICQSLQSAQASIESGKW